MSYLRSLYGNDDFQKLKKVEEEEMYSQAKKEVQNKQFIGEMD